MTAASPTTEFPSAPHPLRTTDPKLRVESSQPRELVLQTDLAPGHYRVLLRTHRGRFPMETLHLPLLEWPSLKRVPCGPFDFDHTENRMVVPCFDVRVDDQPDGLAWFDIPSAEMVEGRFFETSFGFAVDRPGKHPLLLGFREDETRISWQDVEEVRVERDPRQPVPCPVRDGVALWADDGAWRALRENPSPSQRLVLDSLLGTMRDGTDVTYGHRTLMLAMLHRLEAADVRDELRARAAELVARRSWGFHDVEGELGCDNDRDAGMRLMEASAVLAWASDALGPDARAALRAKVEHHARVLYRFTVLQTAYWPDTTMEAHGLGGWLGLAVAGAALCRESPEAQRWLDWSFGNFLRNADFLPRDGYNPWPVFNTQWAVYLLALFENLLGRRLLEDNPFFKSHARTLCRLLEFGAILPLGDVAAFGKAHLREEPLILARLGARNRDEAALAWAARGIRATLDAGHHLPPLLPFFAPADLPEATPPPPRRPGHFHARNGEVLAIEPVKGRDLLLHFRCGTPQGPENAARLNRYMQFHNNPGFGGSFELSLDRKTVIAGPGGSYDYRTAMYQMVSIDGGGHLLEHRYGGFRLKPTEQPSIRRFEETDALIFLEADVRPGYRADLPLARAARRLVLLKGLGIIVVADDFLATAPVRFAHHLNTPGTFEAAGPGRWRATTAAASLYVAVLAPEGCAASVSELAWVPTYSLGLNSYKSRDWQPEVHAQFKKPPSFQHLAHAAAEPCTEFRAVAVFSMEPLAPSRTPREDGGFRVNLREGLALEVDADAARFNLA